MQLFEWENMLEEGSHMGLFDRLKRKKKSEYIEEKPRVLPVIAFPSQKEEKKEEIKWELPVPDEYMSLTSGLSRAWLKKFEKKKKYNYENGIVEELYDMGYLSALDLRRLLKEEKEETEKLISFYTEHEPTEENIDLYEEFMIRHKLYRRIEITDKTYNTLCSYISHCYDERPSGRAIAGELTVYSLSYDQYQKLKPMIEKEISILTDDTIADEEKCRVMQEIRLTVGRYLTSGKAQFVI